MSVFIELGYPFYHVVSEMIHDFPNTLKFLIYFIGKCNWEFQEIKSLGQGCISYVEADLESCLLGFKVQLIPD